MVSVCTRAAATERSATNMYPKGGGNGFVFNMGGGPGVRVHQMGGGAPRRRPHNHANQPPASPMAALQSLLPLLLLFIIPLLSSLFSGAEPTYPSVVYDKASPPHTLHHSSGKLKVDYFVNPQDTITFTPRNWRDLDSYVEQNYVQRLATRCQWEKSQKRQAYQEAQGFWSRDPVKYQLAQELTTPACDKLTGWNFRID